MRVPTYPWQRQRLWAARRTTPAEAASSPVADASVEETGVSEAPRPRPDLTVPYVAPRNEMEDRIARVWQEVLRLEPRRHPRQFLRARRRFAPGGHSAQSPARGSQCGGSTPRHVRGADHSPACRVDDDGRRRGNGPLRDDSPCAAGRRAPAVAHAGSVVVPRSVGGRAADLYDLFALADPGTTECLVGRAFFERDRPAARDTSHHLPRSGRPPRSGDRAFRAPPPAAGRSEFAASPPSGKRNSNAGSSRKWDVP